MDKNDTTINRSNQIVDASTTKSGLNELVRIVETHLNPVTSSTNSTTNTTSNARHYTPPMMGTSVRMAKRRTDADGGIIKIEGTDIINPQLQPHYQNVQSVLDERKQTSSLPIDESNSLPQSFSERREYFEQRFKTAQPTYDTPPRQTPSHKIITTITTTTKQVSGDTQDHMSSSSNESPSVDCVLEQAVELQKLSHINKSQPTSDEPVVIERTEQYQVYLDSSNHEVHRTPSVSRTALVSSKRTGHATDLDQVHIERFSDDHQAIQDLTRVLQEHNQTTTMDYSSFSSDSHLPLSSIRTLADRPAMPIESDFTVIDALLSNPIATNNEKSNHTLQWRYQDILSNVRNPQWIDLLKQSSTQPVKTGKEKKSKNVKEKTKTNKKQEKPNETSTPNVANPELSSAAPAEQVVDESSDQTPLIDPKDKKKNKKETKEKTKTKTKTKDNVKDKTIPAEYQTLDAIIGSPTSIRLPDAYLDKYKQLPPLSQSSPIESLPAATVDQSADKKTKTKDKKKDKTKDDSKEKTKSKTKNENKNVEEKPETLFNLVNIVNELLLHNAAALTVSSGTTSSSTKNVKENDPEPITPTALTDVTNEVVHRQPLLEKPTQLVNTHAELRTSADSNNSRTVYRYIDDQGRVLAVSSTPPSQLPERSSHQHPYQNGDTSLLHGRQIAVDDERRHPLPQQEQRATWQGEPKLPTTVTREDFELRDKRVPQISDQPTLTSRNIPVAFENDSTIKVSNQGEPSTRSYQQQNQQNLKLAWMPLSYPNEQVHGPSGVTGYETDSTISERSASANYRTYDCGPSEGFYRSTTSRPTYQTEYRYQHRSPGPSYYPPPPPLPYSTRALSPEYGIPTTSSRNYLEVFRGGDFQESKPSEIYSLPLSEYMRRSPIPTGQVRPSRYDQYQSERYSTLGNRRSTPSLQPGYLYNDSRYSSNIPTTPPTVYTSTYYAHRSPPEHRYVQRSPHREYHTYVRPSKSFDYRPLRTKLQREYKITPNLLVDDWEFPSVSERNHFSTATSATNRSGVSSPDDVFISNRTSID